MLLRWSRSLSPDTHLEENGAGGIHQNGLQLCVHGAPAHRGASGSGTRLVVRFLVQRIQLIHNRISYKFSCPDATSGHILCLPFDVLCVALCSAGHATQLQRICDCLLHHPADVEHAGPLGSHNATDSGGQPHAAHLQLLVQ